MLVSDPPKREGEDTLSGAVLVASSHIGVDQRGQDQHQDQGQETNRRLLLRGGEVVPARRGQMRGSNAMQGLKKPSPETRDARFRPSQAGG